LLQLSPCLPYPPLPPLTWGLGLGAGFRSRERQIRMSESQQWRRVCAPPV
jgi:hypothetical protein